MNTNILIDLINTTLAVVALALSAYTLYQQHMEKLPKIRIEAGILTSTIIGRTPVTESALTISIHNMGDRATFINFIEIHSTTTDLFTIPSDNDIKLPYKLEPGEMSSHYIAINNDHLVSLRGLIDNSSSRAFVIVQDGRNTRHKSNLFSLEQVA